MVKKGKIVDFIGSWGSGLATLVVEDDDGKLHNIPCENAPTVRALESDYGNVIGEGHTALVSNIKGKEIFYEMGDMGLVLGWFVPIEEAPPEVWEEYEKQKKQKSNKNLKELV